MSEGIAGPALAAFAAAATLALVLTPLVGRVAHRFDVLDRPEERRVNTSPIPRGGGIAVAAAFVITSLGLIVADARFGIWPASDAPGRSSRSSAALPSQLSSAAWTTGSTSALAGSWPGSSSSRGWPSGSESP